jgi:tetratricopeptide (TPR) repeat protein
MAKAGELSVDLTANTARFKGQIKGAGRAVSTFERLSKKSFGSVNRTMNKLSKSIFSLKGAIAGLGIAKSVQLFVRQEQAVFQLEQRIKSTGGAAGLTSQELQKMASSLQKVTTFGDEAVIEMQSLLLTFTRIRGDTFKRAQEAVLNVATALGTDLKSAAIQVGKALNDPVGQMTALSRSGIILSDSQKELIRDFAEAGELAKAQAVILKELETEFGGAAKAAAKGLGGSLKQLSNAFGDMLETLVKVTQSDSGNFISWMKDIVNYINDKVLPAFSFFAEKLGLIKRSIDSLTVDEAYARMGSIQERIAEMQKDIAATPKSPPAGYEILELKALGEEYARLKERIDQVNGVGSGQQATTPQPTPGIPTNGQLQSALENLQTSLMTAEQLENRRYEQALEALAAAEQAKIDTIIPYKELREQLEVQHQQKLLSIEEKAAQKRAAIEQRVSNTIISLKANVVQQAAGLLRTMAGDSKAAAVAVIALEKGLAIAQTVMNTNVASMRALAELGPIAGPPAAAKIQALGNVAVGLIAAQGLAQAASVGGGGASLGSPANPVNTTSTPPPVFGQQQAANEPTRRIEIDIRGADDEQVSIGWVRDKLMPSIKEALDDGYVL